MNQDSIIELVQALDWSLPTSTQSAAIEKLKLEVNESNCHLLIQPMLKFTWPNAIQIIDEMGYPANKNSISSLLWLLKDLSWPGASQGLKILSRINISQIILDVQDAIKQAYDEKDYCWLAGIKSYVNYANITSKDFIDESVYHLLKYAEW